VEAEAAADIRQRAIVLLTVWPVASQLAAKPVFYEEMFVAQDLKLGTLLCTRQ
jgi:hypothetical protein